MQVTTTTTICVMSSRTDNAPTTSLVTLLINSQVNSKPHSACQDVWNQIQHKHTHTHTHHRTDYNCEHWIASCFLSLRQMCTYTMYRYDTVRPGSPMDPCFGLTWLELTQSLNYATLSYSIVCSLDVPNRYMYELQTVVIPQRWLVFQ